VHLVYPHGTSTSNPDAIGRNLGERLEHNYRVVYHDWWERGVIRPEPGDVLLGHPHPAPGTIFRRSARERGWSRVLMLAPYNGDPAQVAFADSIVRHCDIFLAISGPFWFSVLGKSAFSHWAPKMVRLDLAVDRADYPPLKIAFNPPGKRRFVYIGHAGRMKNTRYLGEIARRLPDTEFAWIGPHVRALIGVSALGRLDFSGDSGRDILASFDFLITVGRADANPTTILEAMAWGLIPVCTPQSGYQGISSIVNVPLDDADGAVAIILGLQTAPDADLGRAQRANWQALDDLYTWDRFASQVAAHIDSQDSPRLGREGVQRRLQLAWAALSSYHTSPIRYWSARGRARLRAVMHGVRTAVGSGTEGGRTSR